MTDHTDRTEPVPRRIRGILDGQTVFDTIAARYVWDKPNYPAYVIPMADVTDGVLVDDDHPVRLRRGPAARHSLVAGTTTRAGVAHVYGAGASLDLEGMVRFDWAALDAWFEEDEEIFVHPRNPYTRVDALRSSRTVRVEYEGHLLAESSRTVMVFETGLPTRYYLDRTDIDWAHLIRTDAVSECPYKGTTTDYWSMVTDAATVDDVAWSYQFPTRQLLPIAGLVAFYNEICDITVDGVALERPTTHLR